MAEYPRSRHDSSPPWAHVQQTEPCLICGEKSGWRWTDTHGVGACWKCGAPYQLYHYGENEQRVSKPPQLLIRTEWVPLIKRYWEQNHCNCDPGAYNIPGSRYEVATEDDYRIYNAWIMAHRAEWPQGDSPPS